MYVLYQVAVLYQIIVLHYIKYSCIVLYQIQECCIVTNTVVPVLYFVSHAVVVYCIVLYCIVLYCIALHCIVLYCISMANYYPNPHYDWFRSKYRHAAKRRGIHYTVYSLQRNSYCLLTLCRITKMINVTLLLHPGMGLALSKCIQWRSSRHTPLYGCNYQLTDRPVLNTLTRSTRDTSVQGESY